MQKLLWLVCQGLVYLFYFLCSLTLLLGSIVTGKSADALLRDRFGTFQPSRLWWPFSLVLDGAIVLGVLLLIRAILGRVATWPAGLAVLSLFIAGIPVRTAIDRQHRSVRAGHRESLLRALGAVVLTALAVFLLLRNDGFVCPP